MRATREAEVADLHHPKKDAVMIFVTTHNTPVRGDAVLAASIRNHPF